MHRLTQGVRAAAGFSALMALAFLASCYPGDVGDVAELDLVLTRFDDQADFTTNRTFVLDDTVRHLRDPDDENPPPINREFDEFILDEVRRNLIDLGYQEIADTDTPDVYVSVAELSLRREYYYTWYPGYPCWSPWYCYPWYPWPPAVGSGSYTQGTLWVQMGEPDRELPGGEGPLIPIIWAGIVNGVVSGNSTEARISRGVEQAFVQSPYLNRN
jgi:hypothetical protein